MRSPLYDLSDTVCNDCIYISNELVKLKEYTISNQLKKSATSIGANIREARFAESKKDFIHKMHIASKECNETIYWIRIINNNFMKNNENVKSAYNNCYSILRILIKTIITAKKNLILE